MLRSLALIACMPVAAWAQPGPNRAALDDAVRLGVVAALAPLCGIRPEAWSFDLRRATIFEATRPARVDDPALRAVPGSELIVGALSHGETEALESFAQAMPDQTCEPLKIDPDLVRADTMVKAFRELRMNLKPAS